MHECIKINKNYAFFLKKVVKDIMEKCILKGIKGNLSCIFLSFEKNKKLFEEKNEEKIRNIIITLSLSNQNCEKIYDNLDESKLYIYNNNYNNTVNNINNTMNEREKSVKENNTIKKNSPKADSPKKEQEPKNVNKLSNFNLPVSFTFKKKKKKIFCCGCI